MLKIKIKHNILIDFKIFLRTLRLKKWLDENGYEYYLFENITRRISYREIASEVEKEFNTYKNKLERKVHSLKDYNIYLTKFGTYGGYDVPNKVYVNVFRNFKQMAQTIVHEMIHLEIEKEVLKRKLSHSQKEKLADDISFDVFNKQ